LTYLFWELAKHKEWQDKLRNELKTTLAPEVHEAPPYHTLAALPVLDAVINESLRLHPAAPASLQRSTPTGGRDLDGYHIPQGVSQSNQIYLEDLLTSVSDCCVDAVLHNPA
jgi:cytochrome P450